MLFPRPVTPPTRGGRVAFQIRDRQAFAGITLGDGISLYMTEYLDSGGCASHFAELAKQDERDDWRKLSDEILERFTVTFSFTDLQGFRFYLAPYMLWAIRNHRTSDSIICDFTIYALDPSSYQFTETKFTEWFTPVQQAAILAFLDYATNVETMDSAVACKHADSIRSLLMNP